MKNAPSTHATETERRAAVVADTATAPAEPYGFPERPRFEITDLRGLVWYARKMRQIGEEIDALKAASAARLAELESDRRRLEHLYSAQAEAVAREEAQRRRRKTITLPEAGCAVAIRTVTARVEIEDESTAAEVARSLGYMKMPTVDLSAYRAAATEALEQRGELLPGCRLAPETEKVSIRRLSAKDGEEASEA